ncbi:membrane protein [Microbispora sp. ATCC PTA-5024]|uniref:membrane protein n=1 Tax=Microbispora sp. ATCC PTA-5024 TaxID=316330 RepID=UPI0003DC9C4E|nr:membrane protein [Microbispora sp. ATCC PTA-5024]ETK36663.1 membrane protein [Microbispora sp. ATCC PTA-5024]
MTEHPSALPSTPADAPACACADACCGSAAAAPASGAPPAGRDESWMRAARWARALSWVSLVWMTVEGAVGIAAGVAAASIALIGWALSSAVEGLASVIVIWRFTGSRTLSETAEGRAQKAVAVSFWLLAPYVAVEAVHKLVSGQAAESSVPGIVLTALSLVLMPLLGVAKHRLGARLGSGATAGEGTQNLLCAYLAGAVLAGLAANAWLGWWWLDPLIGLAVAAVAVKEGRDAWRGEECC